MGRMFVVFGALLFCPFVALAQQPTQTPRKIKSPGEIAAASRYLVEKKEVCRRRAKEEKLTSLKRHRFIRECTKQ
jgi:hypothetical protein